MHLTTEEGGEEEVNDFANSIVFAFKSNASN